MVKKQKGLSFKGPMSIGMCFPLKGLREANDRYLLKNFMEKYIKRKGCENRSVQCQKTG